MTPHDLTEARRKLGMNKAEFAKVLRTPYRTYQDWEGGKRAIPGVCAVAVEMLVQKDRWVMQTIDEKLKRLDI